MWKIQNEIEGKISDSVKFDIWGAISFLRINLYLQKTDIKANDICKTVKNMFEIYVYSNAAYLPTLVMLQTKWLIWSLHVHNYQT
jgi:hypothetical protein